MYPIVEYGHIIGKNTAEFTAADMAGYMKWWEKQPSKIEREINIVEQLERAKQIHNSMELNRKEEKMARKHTTTSFQKAQTSRLAERGIESPINGGEEEIIIHDLASENEIVCSMELTKNDVAALIWGLETLLNEYDFEGNVMGESLKSLKEGLEGI